MEKINYLFVCSGNADRSPTAAEVCRDMTDEMGLEIEVKSAGLSVDGGRPVTRERTDIATRIFVMEDYMEAELIKDYSQPDDKIVCLDVKDYYDITYPQEKEELKRIFKEKLKKWLEIDQAHVEKGLPRI